MLTLLLALATSVLTLLHDISGTVVDHDGNPIAGVTVVIVHPTESAKDASTETDAKGQFILGHDDDEGRASNYQLLAWKNGYAAAVHRHDESSRSYQLELGNVVRDELKLVLPMPNRSHPLVIDPDGKPVVGAKLTPYYLGKDSEYVYRESGLPGFLTTNADASGQVHLNGVGDEIGGGFLIAAKGFGSQRFGVGVDRKPLPKKISLSPTGSLRGRIVCDDVSALKGWRVNLNSSKQTDGSTNDDIVTASGYAELTSSADGTFDIPSLPAGSYRVDAYLAASRYSAESTTIDVSPGKAADLEITLKAGRRAFGRILERDSDRPIVGAKLYFGGVQAVSDETGAFEGYVNQPPTYVQINNAPDGYIVASHDTQAVEIKDPEATEFDLGAITLKAAVPITGIVTNEFGMPQPRITVSAAWVQTSEGKFQTFSYADDTCVTDAEGRYRLLNSPGDVALLISALGADAATKEPVQVAAADNREVNLTVGRANTAYLTAVINDAEGNAVAAASIRLTYSMETADRGSYGGRSIVFGGKNTLTSDTNGLIRSPVRVPRDKKYSLVISAEGFLPVTTDFRQLGGADDDVLLGEFTLRRARSATGVLVDSAGKPIPGVTVTSHGIPENSRSDQPIVSVQTDDSGRFSLSPLHPATSVVTVRGAGWRPTGAAISPTIKAMSITVYRTDESIPDDVRVKVPESRQIPAAAGIYLLKQLMPDLRNSNYFHAEALALLARVNPERIPDELAETRDASAKVQALVTLQEFEEANAQAERIESGYSRAYARFKVIDACPDEDLKLSMIAAALVDGKSVQQPDRRAVVLAGVADRLIAMDQHDEAKALLQDSLEQFRQLPSTEWAGFAKGFFAERLARYDFDAAIAMLQGMEPDDRARHAGNIAHALAAVDPEKAEKSIAESDATRSVIAYRIRVCYRMAAVDLERAERVRQGHPANNHTFAKEHSLGVMAMGIHNSDPQKSKELLNQAWTELEAIAGQRTGYIQEGVYRFGVALALLSYAEVIDAENLTDHFWRAIALYPGPQGNSWQPEQQQIEDIERQAMLVLAFGLYNREPEMCRLIMEPAFAYWSKSEHLQNHDFYRKTATFSAMAFADPKRAAQWAVDAYGMMPVESRRLIPQPWLTVAQTLCSDRLAIQNMLAEEVFTRWYIDKYDL